MLIPKNDSSETMNYRVVEASFVTSAPSLKQCPVHELPEIAIAGRSNVGKSSLINLLCNQRNLAKTSGTPGKTRLINYFLLRIQPEEIRFHLVDLPGYGFSKAGKALQQEWGRSLEEFLQNRPLQGILHLVDARHDPTSLDRQMREWILHHQLPAITILTKMDKLKKNQITASRKSIIAQLNIHEQEPCILTSVLQKKGISEVLMALVSLLKNC